MVQMLRQFLLVGGGEVRALQLVAGVWGALVDQPISAVENESLAGALFNRATDVPTFGC